MRWVMLDTETTGLRVEEGHRLIEIGCIECIDRRITDRSFHVFINRSARSMRALPRSTA